MHSPGTDWGEVQTMLYGFSNQWKEEVFGCITSFHFFVLLLLETAVISRNNSYMSAIIC